MEHQTGFNLNEALTNWRTRELESQPGVSADTARELESHLRDSVADLQGKGLSEEEAFWLAQRRLGSPEKLAAEITKADPARLWTERVFWMVSGIILSYVLYIAVFCPLFFAVARFRGESYSTYLNALSGGICIALAAFASFIARGRFPRFFGSLSGSVGFFCMLGSVALIAAYLLFRNVRYALNKDGRLDMDDLSQMFSVLILPLVIGWLLVHLRRKLAAAGPRRREA